MLRVNEVFSFEGELHRVLRLDKDCFYLIDISNTKGLPRAEAYRVFEALADTGEIVRADDPYMYLQSLSLPSDSSPLAKLNEKYSTILPIIEDARSLDKKARALLILKICEETKKSQSTIYRLLRRYWQRGQTKYALLPDYGQSQSAGARRNFTNKKPGRPRIFGVGNGVAVTDEVRHLFNKVIDKYLLNDKSHQIKYAYRKFQDAYLFKHPNAPEYDIPTYRQFYYHYQTETQMSQRIQSRAPENIFNKDIKPVRATATEQALGPGSRYEIDATIADIYLVDDTDGSIILGRPTIYMVIDVFSRMVAGFYIGYDNPSYPVAMKALACSFASKVEACKQYGINITDAQWPCIGVPDVVLADRGELMSHQADYLIDALRLRLETPPPGRGDAKGIVERSFRARQAVFKKYVPGVVEGNKIKKHGERDYRLEACLSKSDFVEILLFSIVAHNTQKPMEKYDRGPDIPDDVPNIPLALWNWGISNRTGKLKAVDFKVAQIKLLPRHPVSISDKGVKLWGVTYTSSQLLASGWMHRSKSVNRPQNLVASYDLGSANQIYLYFDEESHDYWVCDLTSRSREFKDMTWYQVWERQAIQKQKMAESQYDYAPVERDLDKLIEEKVKAAKLRYSSPAKSDVGKIRAIKGNKRDAIQQERKEMALTDTKTGKDQSADIIPLSSLENDYQYPDFTPELFDKDDE
ncbi:MAG: transposase [Glaciecola sp.]|jgi:hypothetical protein